MALKELVQDHYGIIDAEHIGDGAYVGRTAEGIALFTSNGVSITRPVYLDDFGWKVLQDYVERIKKNE